MAGMAGIPAWNDYAVRLKAQDLKSPVFIAYPFSTKLDELALTTYRAAYSDIARLGFAVASMVNDGGASTLARRSLARRANLLTGKKLVVWEIVERDFRFGEDGWKDVALGGER